MKRTLATTLALVLAMAIGGGGISHAQNAAEPKRHFKIQKPAQLDPAEALTIYDNVADRMAKGYAASGDTTAKAYRDWRLYNTAPYRSATHGNRYVNNYVNPIGKAYGTMKPGDRLPAGTIIAKDSLTVTSKRDVFAGALFIMERLPTGQSPKTADWRYKMIMPDGSLFGDTRGDNADKVAFCHDCHVAASDDDYLFFMPEEYKRQFLD